MRIRKYTSIFLGGLIAYTTIYSFVGLGGLLEFSFFDRELMINNKFTAGHTSEAMRWQHFFVWLPANIAGLYACFVGIYIAYLARAGQFFTAKFARGLGHVGYAVLITGVFDVVASGVVPHVLSSLNPGGKVPIELKFFPDKLGLVMCGIGFVAVGHMMAEATRLSDENRRFV